MWLLPLSLVAQQRPLLTPEAEVIQAGEFLVQFGFEFLEDQRFPLAGLEGNLMRVGVLGLRFGVSRAVEVQAEGTLRNFLSVSERQSAFVTPILGRSGQSTSDIGDFSVAAKVRLFSERSRRPALGSRFGFEMPNSNQRRGIGLNTTNVFSTVLAEKHFGQLTTFVSVGLAILDGPAGLFTQNDVVLLGVGVMVPVNDRLKILGEAQGRKSIRATPPTSPLVGTGSRGQARLGVQIFAGGFRWDLATIVGLTRDDADTGFTFGVAKNIKLFSAAGGVR